MSSTGFRRLLGMLACCAASFIAAGFFGAAFAATHDFNNDARSDILWRNTMTGQVVIWLLNGTTVLPTSGSPGSADPNVWFIVSQRDFNGDGKADILWRHGITGQTVVWLINGTSIIGGGSLGSAAFPWAVFCTRGVNGGGLADLLLGEQNTRQVVVWLLNGTSVIGGGSPGNVGVNEWFLRSIGDVNGDGKADIIWWNSNTGQVVIWLMDGASVTGGGSPGSADLLWFIVVTSDFNGDG